METGRELACRQRASWVGTGSTSPGSSYLHGRIPVDWGPGTFFVNVGNALKLFCSHFKVQISTKKVNALNFISHLAAQAALSDAESNTL